MYSIQMIRQSLRGFKLSADAILFMLLCSGWADGGRLVGVRHF